MLMNIAPQTPAQVQKNDSAFVAHTVVLAKKTAKNKMGHFNIFETTFIEINSVGG